MDHRGVAAHGRRDRRGRHARRLPQAARRARRRPGGLRSRGHPRRARPAGSRQAELRLHEQRHLVRAPGGGPGVASPRCCARPARAASGSPSSPGPGRVTPAAPSVLRAHARRLRRRAALGQRARGARHRVGALGTSLGVDLETGRPVEDGHQNHMRAINGIHHAGGIGEAVVQQGVLTRGVMHACHVHNVPFVLAGSIRDDGPLPDTVMDLVGGAGALRRGARRRGRGPDAGSMLHWIGVGNMLPSWVKVVCVDINPAVVTKLERSRLVADGRRRDRRRAVPEPARRSPSEAGTLMFTTLIDPPTLAAHLDDPAWVVLDARFDLAAPDKGEALFHEGHIPGARYVHLDTHLSGAKTGTNGRHPLPSPEDAADALRGARHRPRHAGRALRRRHRHVRGARLVDAALAGTSGGSGARWRLRRLAARRTCR